MQNNNTKIIESKKLLQDYGDAIIQIKAENEKKKQSIAELKNEYKRIPKIIRNMFLKDARCKRIIDDKI